MGIYNVAQYGNFGTELAPIGTIYGETPKLQFYAEPFLSSAISYTQAQLTWIQPAGDYSDLRIVRSNDGFPETAEDGAIIYEWNELTSGTQITSLIDGNDPTKPLVSGKFVYYRIWVKKDGTEAWAVVGDSYTLIPIRHATFAPDKTLLVDTKNKLLDVIPRVYTSASQSPIDEVDPNSDLSIFLDAFAFEVDRSLTYADLLLPLEAWRLVGPDILALQSLQLGLPLEPYLATKQQRRLAREAQYIYENKGTAKSIGTFIESLTGFAPIVTPSPNLVLTSQDSTFTGGVGFWRPVGNVTIQSVNDVPSVPPPGPGVTGPTEPYVDDYRYVAKIVSGEVGSRIVNGADNPITTGTPVQPGVAYTFSGYGQAASGTMGVKGYALWYDLEGKLIDTDPPRTFVQTPQTVTTDWTKFSFVGRSPGVVKTIQSYSVTSEIATLYLGEPNIMVRGETIIIEGIPALNNAAGGTKAIYQIQGVGNSNPATINQIYLSVPGLADTSGTREVSAQFIEASPTTVPSTAELAVQIPAGTIDPKWIVAAGQIVDGVGSVTFAAAPDLVVGDKIVIQAMSTYFSFGVHTITAKVDNTVSFQIYEPYTGVINTTLDEGPYLPGAGPGPLGTWGFAIKIVPGTATPVLPAYYASFELEMASTGTLYMDLLQMTTIDVQEFHEARAVEVFLQPTKTNFLKNPGFRVSDAARNVTRFNATSTTSAVVYTALASTYYPVGTKVTLVAGTPAGSSPVNLPSYALGTWTVTEATSTTLTIAGTGFTVADTTGINATKNITAFEWDILAESRVYDVSRTSTPVGRTGAGTVLEVDTYSPRGMTQYTVSSGTATITTATSHGLTTADSIVILPPAFTGIMGATVASNVVTFTVVPPTSGYAPGQVILVMGETNADFAADFNNRLFVIAAVGTNTITAAPVSAPAIANKTYTVSATPYGGLALYHPVYGGPHDISAVTSTTISFPAPVGYPDVTTPVPLVTAVGVVTSVSTISAPVTSGKFITASFYAKAKVADTTETLTMYLNAVDVAKVTDQIVASSETAIQITDEWARYSATLFVPKVSPDTIVVSMAIAGVTTGNIIYLDQAQVENSFTASDYFYGGMTSAVVYGAVWEDPTQPHRTPTHLYPNLPAKITRLRQELPKYIPMNTSFLVRWHGGGATKPNV